MENHYPVSNYKMEIGWGDCDAAGITYYAQYFDWFCNARFHLLKEHGIKYTTWFLRNHISLVVLDTGCRYKNLLYPEESITIKTTLVKLTRTRAKFTYDVFKDDNTLAASGFTTHTYVNQDGKVCNLEKCSPELWEKLSSVFLNNKRFISE